MLRYSPASWFLRFWPPRAYVKINYDNKVLLVQNWLGSGKWSFPGGGVHLGEESKSGACREVLEEIGLELTPSDLKLLTSGYSKYLFGGKKFVVYETTLKDQPNIAHGTELTDVAWVRASEMKNYDLTNAVQVVLAKKTNT